MAFKVPETELNLVIGVHGNAIPVVLTDALWTRFKIGEQYEVTDAGTKAAGVRNLFSLRECHGVCTRHAGAVRRRTAEARRAIHRLQQHHRRRDEEASGGRPR